MLNDFCGPIGTETATLVTVLALRIHREKLQTYVSRVATPDRSKSRKNYRKAYPTFI